ncbi:hypothetical protein ACK3SF_03775 [Candidatus Nanosalina sp. VS9-1]
MSYKFTCERCGKMIEEASRMDYVSELEKHFRNNHPSIDHSKYVSQQNI